MLDTIEHAQSVRDDLSAYLSYLFIPWLDGRCKGIAGPVCPIPTYGIPKQAVPVGNRSTVRLEIRQIGGTGLAKEDVERPTTLSGKSKDEIYVLRREEDRGEQANQRRETRYRLTIEVHTFAGL